MLSRFINKYPIFLIGILVILLLFSFVYERWNNNNKDIASSDLEFNTYIESLPAKYAEILNELKVDDTNFFCSIYEDYARREIVVFKISPTREETNTDFSIDLYINDPKNKKVPFVLENSGVIYNHNGKTYGVYRKELPFIDIKELVVKRKVTNKYQKKWSDTIQSPFTSTLEDNPIKIASKGLGTQVASSPYISLFTNLLQEREIKFLPFSYIVTKDVLKQTQDDLGEYINNHKLVLGLVKNPKKFWLQFNAKDKNVLKQISFIGENQAMAKELIGRYLADEVGFESVFDSQKLAEFFAFKEVFTNRCNEPLHFIYNTATNLLEPYFVRSKCIGKMSNYLVKPPIDDVNFIKSYLSALSEVSQMNLYEDLIVANPTFEAELALINKYNPQNVFNLDILQINQRIINNNFNTKTQVRTELVNHSKQKMVLTVSNFSNFPIEIEALKHEEKKSISTLNEPFRILSGEKDTIVISLPRSFENLFVSKKKKVTGFVLHKHIYDLSLSYSISGLNKLQHSQIIPYQSKENTPEDIFRTEAFVNNHKAISVDKKKRIITFTKDSVIIDAPLVIPSGFLFKIKQGTTLNIVNGGKIITHSPLAFTGTKQKPIKFLSSDKKGQGILILSEGELSNLSFVEFENLTNPKHGNWSVTGAVTFYESPVKLDNVVITGNRCEDALNIVRTTFLMTNSTISNTQSDAFDGDFVTGTIKDCHFDALGNDAIDISGSDLTIKNVTISNAGDKGLSAGEDSKMTIDNVDISDSEIAVAGKDLSIVKIKNLKILNTKLGFTAFQKKSEFGPSNITVNGIDMEGIETKYLIENSSSLFVDGEKIETSLNVKDRMYGVEFGKSSAETRNANN